METKELNGYRVEFYSDEEWGILDNLPKHVWIDETVYSKRIGREPNTKFAGLVSDISEKLAEKIVDKHQYNQIDRFGNLLVMYKDYGFERVNNEELFDIDFAKQSFQTLSDLRYCVVSKV